LIIGLSGPAGAGKDTVGRLIHEATGFPLKSLARPMKEEIADYLLYGKYEDELPQTKVAEFAEAVARVRWIQPSREELITELSHPIHKKQYRKLMQFWGTDFRRYQNPKYWINKLNPGLEAIITDVRFPNEVDYIHKFHGLVFYIYSETAETQRQGHSSENSIEIFHCDDTILWPRNLPEFCVEYLNHILDHNFVKGRFDPYEIITVELLKQIIDDSIR
jgi:hypothetical protein